jgi:hypothetical protein
MRDSREMKSLRFWAVTVCFCLFGYLAVTADAQITVVDSGSNHHDGTLVGSPPPEFVAGISGTALSFNGQNYVDVPNSRDFNLTEMTLEAWVNTSSHAWGAVVSTTHDPYLITGTTSFSILRDQFVEVMSAEVGITGGAFPHALSLNPVNDGQWHHLAMTLGGGFLKLYVDGVLQSTTATSVQLTNTIAPLRIGFRDTHGGLYWVGLIDEVRLSKVVRYNTNFTPATSFSVDSNTVAYWNFDIPMNTGCSAIDATPYHHDGTLVGNRPPNCVDGISGTAFEFDTTQNFVNVRSDAALYPQGSFTFETWFKTTSPGGLSRIAGSGYLGTMSSTDGYMITINSDSHNAVFYGKFQNTDLFGISNFAQVTDGNWHHFAVTWDSASRSLRVFTDGNLGETKTTAGRLVIGTSPFMVGRTPGGFPLGGPITIDEVRLSDTVRYTANFTPATSFSVDSNTVAYWNFGAVEQGCIPAPPGLTDWWPGDGSTADIVGSNPGTLHGGATFAAGLVDQAFSFDGINSFADFGTQPGNFGTNDFTFDLWVNLRTTSTIQIIIEKYIETENPLRTGWGVAMQPANLLLFYGPLPAPSVIARTVPVIPNSWNHLAVTRQSNSFNLYWNGLVVGTTNLTLNLDSTATLKLAHRGNPSDTPGSADTRNFFLNGLIDEVETFDRVLSANEIDAIFNAGSAGKCKNLPPENQPPVARCRDVRLSAGANCMAAASIDNGSFDPDVGDTITLVQTPPGPYPVGMTSVILTVTDSHGLSSNCTATVTVVDDQPPRITCPANTFACRQPPRRYAIVNYPPPVASDNCEVSSVLCFPPSGSNFPIGTTLVNCIATDTSGNTSTCNFRVTVPIRAGRACQRLLDATAARVSTADKMGL